jgi:hypothetical protein
MKIARTNSLEIYAPVVSSAWVFCWGRVYKGIMELVKEMEKRRSETHFLSCPFSLKCTELWRKQTYITIRLISSLFKAFTMTSM